MKTIKLNDTIHQVVVLVEFLDGFSNFKEFNSEREAIQWMIKHQDKFKIAQLAYTEFTYGLPFNNHHYAVEKDKNGYALTRKSYLDCEPWEN